MMEKLYSFKALLKMAVGGMHPHIPPGFVSDVQFYEVFTMSNFY